MCERTHYIITIVRATSVLSFLRFLARNENTQCTGVSVSTSCRMLSRQSTANNNSPNEIHHFAVTAKPIKLNISRLILFAGESSILLPAARSIFTVAAYRMKLTVLRWKKTRNHCLRTEFTEGFARMNITTNTHKSANRKSTSICFELFSFEPSTNVFTNSCIIWQQNDHSNCAYNWFYPGDFFTASNTIFFFSFIFVRTFSRDLFALYTAA